MGIYSGKKILVLAGKPIGSEDIVKYARESGAYVIVTDNLAIENSLAKKIADEHWDISTAEVEKLCEEIKKNKVDAVFTGIHEFNIWRTLDVCEILNYPFYATRDQLQNTSVKTEYKQLFRDFGIPVVEDFTITQNDWETQNQEIKYPVLLKPVDGSGGYGISICYNEEEFKTGFEKALESSKVKKVLVEKFVKAKEVTIFYIIQNGKIKLSAMADRHTENGTKYTIPLPVLYIFPSIHLESFQENFNEKFIQAFESLGLKNGMLFIQAFADDGKIIPYDIGFRLTGTQEYHILEALCGYNPLKMLVDYAITGEMGKEVAHLADPKLGGKHAFIITFLIKPCKVGEFIGLEEVKKMDGVIKVIKNHQLGDEIPESATGTLNQVILRVLGAADSRSEMKELIKKIIGKIEVRSDQGNSVILPTINIDEL